LQPKRKIERGNEPLSPVSLASPDEDATTQKRRKRNRVAAAKCREKAKKGMDELQQRERDLLQQNKMLNMQLCSLRNEVIELKSEILRHSKCDNECIQQYIQKAAGKIGGRPSRDTSCGSPVALTAR
jgi:hypothetical protein